MERPTKRPTEDGAGILVYPARAGKRRRMRRMQGDERESEERREEKKRMTVRRLANLARSLFLRACFTLRPPHFAYPSLNRKPLLIQKHLALKVKAGRRLEKARALDYYPSFFITFLPTLCTQGNPVLNENTIMLAPSLLCFALMLSGLLP